MTPPHAALLSAYCQGLAFQQDNKDHSDIKRLQVVSHLINVSSSCFWLFYINKLADLVGFTVAQKECNVVLESKYGAPNIINDGITMAKEATYVLLEIKLRLGQKLIDQRKTEVKSRKCVEYNKDIFIGGGCTLLRLASKVDSIIESLENDERKVGDEISIKAQSYLLKLVVMC
ncbi:hypothetical protein ACP4OV_017344 [Aristida adscensionis]